MAQILLVEDQPNQRQLYAEELTDCGYDVKVASNGPDALEMFKQCHPQLVVMDVLLPGMNGIEVMERMLAMEPQLPIIVHSAYTSPSHDFITWFARAYVVKSGDLQELKNQVQKALSGTPVVETQDRSGLVSA